MKYLSKVLIISILCIFFIDCKATSDTTNKQHDEKPYTTDDVVDDQMEDYREEVRQDYN